MERNIGEEVCHFPFRLRVVPLNHFKELRRVESELQVELLPGTEIMTDIGSHHFVKGPSHNVLVSQPSDDPSDPLNWSPWWKAATITSASMVTFSMGPGPVGFSPAFPAYIEEFHCTLDQAVRLTSVCILVPRVQQLSLGAAQQFF